MVELLLNLDANFYAEDIFGRTPLKIAEEN
jgi:hypothetical protein